MFLHIVICFLIIRRPPESTRINTLVTYTTLCLSLLRKIRHPGARRLYLARRLPPDRRGPQQRTGIFQRLWAARREPVLRPDRQFHGLRRRAQPDELEGVPLFDDARPHQGISHDRPPSVVRRAREILTCPPGRPHSRPPLRHRGAFRLPEGPS